MPISQHNLVAEFERNWAVARGLTFDLLETVSATQLAFTPHDTFGTLGRQVWHCGHVQEAYRLGLVSGEMAFSVLKPAPEAETDPESLAAFLEERDAELEATLRAVRDYTATVDWGLDDENPEVRDHLIWLLQHETLHQGQWSLYAALAGFELPRSWQDAWGL